MPKIKMPVYPGLSHSLEYDHHVNHMTAQLAQAVEPGKMHESLARIDTAIAKTKLSRIEALAKEIRRVSR